MSKKRHVPERVLVPRGLIDRRIYLIRGQKVMLDADLAEIYQVLTKNLNLAVRRNADRFPRDFMFQLTKKEGDCLRLQFATSNGGGGAAAIFRRHLPNWVWPCSPSIQTTNNIRRPMRSKLRSPDL
jgi:hypothetical protein